MANVWKMQNAMRATMELHGDALEYPSIHAQIALGSEDLTVKVNLIWNLPDLLSLYQNTIVQTLKRPITPVRITPVTWAGWANCSDPVFPCRWVIVGEECHYARLTACSPTRTPRRLGLALTGPELPLWSVFLLYEPPCVNLCANSVTSCDILHDTIELNDTWPVLPKCQ